MREGQATHVKKSGIVTLDGVEEEWHSGDTNAGWNQSGDNLTFHNYYAIKNKKVGGNSITNRFISVNDSSIVGDSSFEGFALGISQVNTYSTIRINKSKLLTEDVDGLLGWSQNNPMTVVYELVEYTYEPIQSDLSVDLLIEI